MAVRTRRAQGVMRSGSDALVTSPARHAIGGRTDRRETPAKEAPNP